MEDLPNYENFTGPGTFLYPDIDPRYNNPGECCCPFDCEWDFLHCLDGNSLDFDWMSQPMESLSTNQPRGFATEPWPDQLDMSLLGNFEEPALPVDLEQPFFIPPTTLGNVKSSPLTPHPNFYPTQNVSASESSISSDSLSIPSTQEMLFPVAIPPSRDTSAFPLYTSSICTQYHPNPQRLKQHQKQHIKRVTCPASTTCTYTTAKNRDMNRHVIVRHPGYMVSVPKYLCPETGCKYAIKGFRRQDHLGRHVKRIHRRPVS